MSVYYLETFCCEHILWFKNDWFTAFHFKISLTYTKQIIKLRCFHYVRKTTSMTMDAHFNYFKFCCIQIWFVSRTVLTVRSSNRLLCNVLIDFGILMKVVSLIKMCLTETRIRVRVSKHLSYMFRIRNGLKKRRFFFTTIAFELRFRVCH